MKPARDITALVVDSGRFLHVAQKLAEQVRTCHYWTPAQMADPMVSEHVVGVGDPNLIRLDDLWEHKDAYDLIVFPDVGFKGLQAQFANQGFAVWGSRDGYQLETQRGRFLKTIKDIGLDVPEYQKFRGMDRLREYLSNVTDVWIKISRWRGDTETFHWRDAEQDSVLLDALSMRMGPFKELLMWYVFEPIDTDIEDGIDTYCIDGALPRLCLHGIEKKDKALLGTVMPFADIDEKIRHVSEAFAPVLGEHGYRQFFSSEVRIAGDKSFFIDPTLRCGSPPSQLQTEIFGNYAEIIWRGANGECIDIEPVKEFGVQLEVSIARDKGEWACARVPEKLRQWLKTAMSCEVKGLTWIVPTGFETHHFGWLLGIGDTAQAAIDHLKENAELLPDGLEADVTQVARLLKEAETMKDEGVPLTEKPIPEPATVIE